MSKDSVLKKDFQKRDVERLRNLVQGKYGEKTRWYNSSMPSGGKNAVAAAMKAKPAPAATTASATTDVNGATPSLPETGNGTAGSPLSIGRKSQSQAAVAWTE